MPSTSVTPDAATTKKSLPRRILKSLQPIPVIGIPFRKLAALAEERDESKVKLYNVSAELQRVQEVLQKIREESHGEEKELQKVREELRQTRSDLNKTRKELAEAREREQSRKIVTGI
jgi:septal ring factor EnvC (AmiA/AmiB activator)